MAEALLKAVREHMEKVDGEREAENKDDDNIVEISDEEEDDDESIELEDEVKDNVVVLNDKVAQEEEDGLAEINDGETIRGDNNEVAKTVEGEVVHTED
jgi:hypothetical protein